MNETWDKWIKKGRRRRKEELKATEREEEVRGMSKSGWKEGKKGKT